MSFFKPETNKCPTLNLIGFNPWLPKTMTLALFFLAFSALGTEEICPEAIKPNTAKSITTRAKRLTPKIIRDNSTRHIGELIAQRHHRLFEIEDEALMTSAGFDYMSKDVKIAMAIGDQELFTMLRSEDPRFLNIHDTNQTNGHSTPRQRTEVEDRLLHLELGDNPEIRPKSAYLFLGDKLGDLDLGQTNVRAGYGEYFAVAKNQVKRRSLFARHDSFAASRLYSFNIKPETPLSATPDMHMQYSAYFEALVFGRFSQPDIDYWMVLMDNEEIREVLGENLDTTLMRLLKTSARVYQGKRINYNGRTEIKRGRKLKLPGN